MQNKEISDLVIQDTAIVSEPKIGKSLGRRVSEYALYGTLVLSTALFSGCVSTKTAEIGDGHKVEYQNEQKPAPRVDGKVYFLGALPEDRYTKEVLDSLPKDIIDTNDIRLTENKYKETIDELKQHGRVIVMYWDNSQSKIAKEQGKNFWTDMKYNYGNQAVYLRVDSTTWSNRSEKARNDLGKDVFPGWIIYGNENGSLTRIRGPPKYDNQESSLKLFGFIEKDSGLMRKQ